MVTAFMRRMEKEQDENNSQAVSKTKGCKQYDFCYLFRKKKQQQSNIQRYRSYKLMSMAAEV